LNSRVYGGIFGICGHPLRPSRLSHQVSIKAGELQFRRESPLSKDRAWPPRRLLIV